MGRRRRAEIVTLESGDEIAVGRMTPMLMSVSRRALEERSAGDLRAEWLIGITPPFHRRLLASL
jgi:hypothetical protein